MFAVLLGSFSLNQAKIFIYLSSLAGEKRLKEGKMTIFTSPQRVSSDAPLPRLRHSRKRVRRGGKFFN
jgi:hypothetical protein